MTIFSFFRKVRLLALLFALIPAGLYAASESYVQSLTGHLKKGDSLTVIDDKFLNLPLDQWNQIQHLSIEDIISFELRRDTLTNYYTKAFSCTLNVTIKYFTSRDQQIPKEIDNIDLVVKYDTAKGKSYVGVANYRFKNAFKVTVVINSINSPEWKDKLPDGFRLKSQILVERKYHFDPHLNGKLHLGAFQQLEPKDMVAASGPVEPQAPEEGVGMVVNNGQLTISWNAADFTGAEEFDLEWTYVDIQSPRGVAINTSYGGQQGPFTIPQATEAQWMQHDATRVTLNASPYTINLPYQDGYVLVRIRSASYQATTNLRVVGDWVYTDDNGQSAVAYILPRQTNLNYQYTGMFAEEGKRKEVINYSDGSLRNRQSVTLNNSDLTYKADGSLSPTAVVKETIFDVMGRPALEVLPAPTKSSLLDYIPSFNLDHSGVPYSFSDITLATPSTGCSISADMMSTTSGASQYYSPANSFLDAQNLGLYYFNPYIPDAKQYPFSVTQFTPDNTGRIARQGGVGQALQTGGLNDTKYFYGKPTQTELQRMFGQEVGDASHYLKNMVIDPNGQAAVTFIDASGRTIATALAGGSPQTMDALSTSNPSTAITPLNDLVIEPTDFVADAGRLKMSATSSFLAETTGAFTLNYSVNPLALTTSYAGGASTLCNNCYYTVAVKIMDPCGVVLSNTQSTPFQVDDFTCHVNPQPVTQSIGFNVGQLGTYTISYSLQLSEQVISDQTDYYIKTNTDLKTLQTFFLQELNALDLSGCYSSCSACQSLGNTVDDFKSNVLNLLATSDFSGITVTSNANDPIQQWITNAWTVLKGKCAQISCSVSSPCEQKLGQLEQDVLPGGQYAEYDPTALQNNATTVFLEPATNVMEFYNQDPAISTLTITAADGSTQQVGNLSQADFVRAYLQHPEWAPLFVVHHIEYCSYLWCKDASNPTPASDNEVSYTFDANLQQNYQAGSDAVVAGYYNHSDPLALLKVDPWFNGAGRGAGYYGQMQADLLNLTTALSINPTDNTVSPAVPLAVKNINQYIDWQLYCMPTDASPSAAELTNSWNNCSPNDNCRSATMEWQLYLNYYMELKSKYYKIAKLAYFAANPAAAPNQGCLDCFIGSDPLTTGGCVAPGTLSDYSVVEYETGNTYNWYIVYNGGKSPFPGSYTFTYQEWEVITPLQPAVPVGNPVTVTANQGDMGVTINSITVPQGAVLDFPGYFVVTNVYCTPNPQAVSCAAATSGAGAGGVTTTPASCPPNDGSVIYVDQGACAGTPGDYNCTFEAGLVYRTGNYEPANVTVVERIQTLNTATGQPGEYQDVSSRTYTISPGQAEIDLGPGYMQMTPNGSGGYSHYQTQTYYIQTIACTAAPTCPALSAFSNGASLLRATSFGGGCTAENFQPYVTYSGPALTEQTTVPVQAVNSVTTSGTTTNTTYNYFAVFTPGGATTVNVTDGSGNNVTYQNESGCSPTNNTWTFTVGPGSPTCTPVPTGAAPPTSMCTDNTLYQEYANKVRVFSDYTNLQGYVGCNAAALSASASSVQQQASSYGLTLALQALGQQESNWLGMLQNVRNSVPAFSGITDATLQTLCTNLYNVSAAYINYESQQGMSLNVVSTLPNPLPSGLTAPAYTSWADAFDGIIGHALVQQGFSADLIGNVYAYNKMPYPVDPNVVQLSSGIFSNVSANVTTFQNAYTAAGGSSFSGYLQGQLGDDWLMTSTQLSDLQTRIANGCTNPYLGNPTILPVSFVVANPASVSNPLDPGAPPVASVTCSQMQTLSANFQSLYTGVPTNSTDPNIILLYQTLFTNYANHVLGYPLSWADYNAFMTSCTTNATALLYDKPQDPSEVNNVFSCAAQQLENTYSKSGQEYTLYINQIRQQFRNAYVSKCLSNQASASITGNQYQYHYTLYYYDLAGNVEKTVPPEGVHLLSDQDLAAIQKLPAQTAAACAAYPANVVTNTATILSDVSSDLQNNAQAMEFWLFNNSGASTRSLRMVTPDGKYMIQAAIANGYVFYEQYSLTPDASGNGIDMTLTNAAVATVPVQEVLQNWSHLMVQSTGGLNGGALTLYLDGNKLTNVPLASAPPYPFGFEIDGQTGGYTLPVTDVSQVQQVRIYQTAGQDNDVALNYQNSCMNPTGNFTNAYELWGLFNPQGFCGNNTAASTLVVVPDRGCLTVSSSPPNANLNNYALQSVTNTFTIEFWANPQAQDNFYTGELGDQYAGLNVFHPYAVTPFWGGYAATGMAGVGISVGTNGVTVFEHADQYIPATLIYQGPINGWTHIAVEYVNKTPSLYINGVLVATGITSPKTYVSPSYNWGGGGYGFFTGSLDEGRIWSVARTPAQIAAAYSQGLAASDVSGLVGYWPMDATYGNIIHDASCNGHDDAFYSPAESWTSAGAAPITDNTYVPFANRLIVPNHGLPTYYAYNSLNQTVSQTTPDMGQSTFVYDRLGRLVISQSAEQSAPTIVDNYNQAGRLSYTRYDALGRIIEVGEKLGATELSETDARVDQTLQNWYNSGSNRQVSITAYDIAPSWVPANLPENNLRKRIAATALLSSGSDPTQNRQSASYYSYDYDGNVAELTQENGVLINNERKVVNGSTGLKDIKYEYDLISGKVNKVLYEDGKWDQFYYQYIYDADNRMVNAYSSRENSSSLSQWNNEVTYRYYLHGPVGRMELGNNGTGSQGVQGLDYAYTLQGWLKGVNGQQVPGNASIRTDMGGDGVAGSNFSGFAQDVAGYSLGYYQDDYEPIGGNNSNYLGTSYATNGSGSGTNLYNGNVSYSTYAISPLVAAGSTSGFSGYTYRYDQLNRMTAMDHHVVAPYTGTANWNSGSISGDYGEQASYDGNGNILTYKRYGTLAGGLMDNLTYNYNRDANGQLLNNQLGNINDAVAANAYSQDLDNQAAGNYTYDASGDLIRDQSENLGRIYWTAYGKVAQVYQGTVPAQGITFGEGPGMVYGYDAGGNRISKTYTATDGTATTTNYVRDIKGNVLAVYEYKTNGSGGLIEGDWSEQHLYGSNRIGMLQPHVSITPGQALANDGYNSTMDAGIEMIGNRLYELNNHLGNVMAVVTDVVNPPGANGNTSSANMATVLSAQDYYPFGMEMPGRTYLASWASQLGYRYGFNRKENDNELEGMGNFIDYGKRIYDPRVGKFLSVDPLQRKFPWYSSYQYAGDRPIEFVDLDGLEPTSPHDDLTTYDGGVTKWNQDLETVYDPVKKQWFTTMNYPNYDEKYYWKNNDGTPGLYPGDKTAAAKGYWQHYMTYEQSFSKMMQNDRTLEYGVIGLVALPYLSAGIAWGLNAIADVAIDGAVQGVLKYYYYAPVIGEAGRRVAEFFDESGGVGMQNQAVDFFAGAAERAAYKYASQLIDEGGKLPRAVTAIVNTKTGATYLGKSGVLKEGQVSDELKKLLPEKSLELWKTHNCAECDALNKALLAGEKLEDLEMHTVKIDDGVIFDFPKCANCEITTKDVKTTSQPK